MPNILVVADADTVALIKGVFSEESHHVVGIREKDRAIGLLDDDAFDVVITDCLDFSGAGSFGPSLLDDLVSNHPDIPCIVYAKDVSVRHSVEAIKRGAFDYLTTLDPREAIRSVVDKATSRSGVAGLRRRKEDQTPGYRFGELVGESPEMQKVFKTIDKVAKSESTVLITGESGTGKELIARAIHYNSHRQHKPLIVINCGAIPGELLESELFGHEKGSFTGAHRIRIGRFELANGGTIFLDEIGDMSPDLQVKLLRVLQEQTFERVGSTKTIQVNIRVLAATNKDLLSSIDEKKFREDLYYRLNVIPIKVPPLRSRKSDIPLLINFFLARLGGRRRYDKKRVKQFSEQVLEAMMKYDWPGNVRELENLMERLSVLVEGDMVEFSDLPESIRGAQTCLFPSLTSTLESGLGFNEAVDEYQRGLILQALNHTHWVKAKAAELLKINRTTLVEKIKKMKIEPPDISQFPQW
ncbi:MAG: sigma-54 dependent transcriptional regulator [Desulfobacterales bacterium]|jgi:DNA-binding NtrC family response regulator|nr:sigma-54 dependent transcriptional regulator [Desulfobacterales bacterium]